MTQAAFELSEQFDTPVLLRTDDARLPLPKSVVARGEARAGRRRRLRFAKRPAQVRHGPRQCAARTTRSCVEERLAAPASLPRPPAQPDRAGGQDARHHHLRHRLPVREGGLPRGDGAQARADLPAARGSSAISPRRSSGCSWSRSSTRSWRSRSARWASRSRGKSLLPDIGELNPTAGRRRTGSSGRACRRSRRAGRRAARRGRRCSAPGCPHRGASSTSLKKPFNAPSSPGTSAATRSAPCRRSTRSTPASAWARASATPSASRRPVRRSSEGGRGHRRLDVPPLRHHGAPQRRLQPRRRHVIILDNPTTAMTGEAGAPRHRALHTRRGGAGRRLRGGRQGARHPQRRDRRSVRLRGDAGRHRPSNGDEGADRRRRPAPLPPPLQDEARSGPRRRPVAVHRLQALPDRRLRGRSPSPGRGRAGRPSSIRFSAPAAASAPTPAPRRRSLR